MMFSGTLCSITTALHYATGAQTALPDRQVVIFTGDRSLSMVLGDFVTLAQPKLSEKVVEHLRQIPSDDLRLHRGIEAGAALFHDRPPLTDYPPAPSVGRRSSIASLGSPNSVLTPQSSNGLDNMIGNGFRHAAP
jgi:hypothetical protein